MEISLEPKEKMFVFKELGLPKENRVLCNKLLYKRESYSLDKNGMLELAAYIVLHYFKINLIDINGELHQMLNNPTFIAYSNRNQKLYEWLCSHKLAVNSPQYLAFISLKDINHKTHNYIKQYDQPCNSVGNNISRTRWWLWCAR